MIIIIIIAKPPFTKPPLCELPRPGGHDLGEDGIFYHSALYEITC